MLDSLLSITLYRSVITTTYFIATQQAVSRHFQFVSLTDSMNGSHSTGHFSNYGL